MIWLQQLTIVLRKDLIIAKRNYRSTLISIFVPVIFVLFLVVLQLAFNSNERLSDIVQPVRTSKETVIPTIPKCFIGRSPVSPTCTTLAYAPQTEPKINEIIDKIKSQNGLTSADVKGFDTSAELDRYLFQYPNTTQGAYNFYLVKDANADVIGARYAIQYNLTTTTFRGKNYDPIANVLLPMQKAADRGIISALIPDRDITIDYNYIGFTHPETLPLDVAAQYGPSFFFGALMFNFVIQLGRLVSEKELKLRSSMKLMGLRDSVYSTAGFVIVLGYNLVSALSLSLAGLAFQMKFFMKNDFSLYFVLFLLFGLAMTPLVLLLAVFVSRSRTATVLGFGVFLVGSIIQGFAQLIFVESTAAYYRIPFSFLPFSLLAKGMMDLSAFSNTEDSPGMRWAQRGLSDAFWPMTSSYNWLIIDTVTFLLLAIYLDQVIPDDNGICQHPLYFLSPSYWIPSMAKSPAISAVDLNAHHYHDVDEDVCQEMKEAMDPANHAPFRMINLQKTFFGYKFPFRRDPTKDFHAVRGVFLTIQPNTLFCLLGHNGAGKTTTLNALTGLTRPTDGDAFVQGKSIRTSMSAVQKSMGVCPQYDILWAQMTAREHLELFAGLKQVPAEAVAQEVIDRLKDVDLIDDADNLAGNFSGGMQRRLSVAIALIGNPEIVYLDEPTTGMDPVSRRKVWNLIERVKRDRITILTTHSMEEADVLSDRIGIMHSGRFACIGNSLRLKQKFGSGYRITVRSNERYHATIEELFTMRLQGSTLVSVEEGGQKFNVPRACTDRLPQFFSLLEGKRREFGIDDIQLSLSTLEEVFLKIGGLGETDDRVGEQEEESKPDELPWSVRIKRHLLRNKLKYSILVILILAIVIAASFQKKSTDSSVADLSIFPESTKYSDLPRSLWAQVQPDVSVAKCARGDKYSFFVKPGATADSNLIIEFQGGGICWDASSCASTFLSSTFNASITTDFTDSLKFSTLSGLFSASTTNPFRNWAHVYIPLCTADSFLGNKISFYDAGLEVCHWGAANTQRVLRWIQASNLSPQTVLVTGWQNGATGAAFHTSAISDVFPSANVTLLADNSFDLSSAENVGNVPFNGLPLSSLLTSSMDEWRLKAYTAWGINSQSAVIPTMLKSATPNITFWSTERLLTELARQPSSKVAIARFNSISSSELSSFLVSVLMQSPSVTQTLAAQNIDIRQFYAEIAGNGHGGGSNFSLSTIICPISKRIHENLLVAARSGGFNYAGFLAAQPASGIVNSDLLFSATGTSAAGASTKMADWLTAFLQQKPLFLTQVFNTSCVA